MILKRIIFMCFSLGFLFISGCSEVQNEYHEVYVIVVENSPFYFINPGDGTASISIKYMENMDPQFVYLYQPIEGTEFSYEHFFSNIQTQYIKADRRDGKLYILSNNDIRTWINQFYFDKAAWESSKSE